MPGEGKSFVATNLALAFAAQGQRTAIVDCDLRKPNIQQSFRLRASKGVISYCNRGVAFDEIVVKNVHPNLDVITSGGRTKNPIQLFNTPEFETLVEELSRRYDKVIFDTPPLGAVSDALNILHLMDGAIYTIRYNRVMRRTARRCARLLSSTDTPVFGAVMNDMNTRNSDEYYVQYHDKLVKEYYNPAVESTAVASRVEA
jgi:capsular exopolysaccharide synthesis family protein